MILAWYEKLVDSNDYLLLDKRTYVHTHKGEHPPHFHNGIEIVLCLSGKSEVFINGKVYPLCEGSVCFVNGLDVHKYRFDKGSTRYVAVISPDILKAVGWNTDTVFPSITNDPVIFEHLKSLFDIAFENWDNDDKMLRIGFAGMLLAVFKRLVPPQGVNIKNTYNSMLIDILQYISSNSEKPLTVEAVAAHFGYTPNYFSSVFKKHTSVAFKEYLNFCRVINYRRLREREEKIGVSEAAERCGFGSLKSLYRACKRSSEMQTHYGAVFLEEKS